MADPRFGSVLLGKSYLDIIKQINANFAKTDTDLLAVEAKAGAGTEALEKKLTPLITANTEAIATNAASIKTNAEAITANKSAAETALKEAKEALEAEDAKKVNKADVAVEAVDGKTGVKKVTVDAGKSAEFLTEEYLTPYAKTADVETKISTAVGDAKKALRDGLVKVVAAIPTVENAEAGVIYLVANGASEGNDLYSEYVLVVDGDTKKVEKLGDLKLVLDDYATKTALSEGLAKKVDKVEGKDLSANDYTNDEKAKLAGIAENATRVLVDAELSDTSVNAVQNKVVKAAIDAAKTELNTEIAKKDAAKQLAITVGDFGEAVDGVYTATIAAKDLYPTGAVMDSTGLARLVDVQKVNDNVVVKSMEAFAGNIMVTTIH